MCTGGRAERGPRSAVTLRNRGLAVAVAGAALVSTSHEPAQPAASYKCYVRDSLTDGLVPNTIRAEGSVDCSGYRGRGSVKFTVRLLEYDTQAKKYRVVASKSRRYRKLRTQHVLVADLVPCVAGRFRGTFKAVLRNAAGARVSTNSQKLGPLETYAPCVFTLR
jgi:hypothetical protein